MQLIKTFSVSISFLSRIIFPQRKTKEYLNFKLIPLKSSEADVLFRKSRLHKDVLQIMQKYII